MNTKTGTHAKPRRRRWLQWSLRSFLVFVLVISVGLGWIANERKWVRERDEAIEYLERRFALGYDDSKQEKPTWLACLLSDKPVRRRVNSFAHGAPHTREDPLTDTELNRIRYLRHLRYVFVEQTEFTDDQLAAFSSLTELEYLSLGGTNITDEGLDFVRAQHNLEYLDLSDTVVTDAGLASLSKLKHLREIELTGTLITDAGVLHLARFENLESVILIRSKVTSEGMEKLKQVKPKLFVLWWHSP